MANTFRRALISLGLERKPKFIQSTATEHHRSAVAVLDNGRYRKMFSATDIADMLRGHCQLRPQHDTEKKRQTRVKRIIRHVVRLSQKEPLTLINILDELYKVDFAGRDELFNQILLVKGLVQKLHSAAHGAKQTESAEKLVANPVFKNVFPAPYYSLVAKIIITGCHNSYINEENIKEIKKYNSDDYEKIGARMFTKFASDKAEKNYANCLYKADPRFRASVSQASSEANTAKKRESLNTLPVAHGVGAVNTPPNAGRSLPKLPATSPNAGRPLPTLPASSTVVVTEALKKPANQTLIPIPPVAPVTAVTAVVPVAPVAPVTAVVPVAAVAPATSVAPAPLMGEQLQRELSQKALAVGQGISDHISSDRSYDDLVQQRVSDQKKGQKKKAASWIPYIVK